MGSLRDGVIRRATPVVLSRTTVSSSSSRAISAAVASAHASGLSAVIRPSGEKETAFDDAPKVRIPFDGGSQRRVAMAGLTGPATYALSANSRSRVDSLERGFLFRLVSRQFEPAQRVNPGFVAQFGDQNIASPHFGTGIMLVEVSGSSGSVIRQNFFNL